MSSQVHSEEQQNSNCINNCSNNNSNNYNNPSNTAVSSASSSYYKIRRCNKKPVNNCNHREQDNNANDSYDDQEEEKNLTHVSSLATSSSSSLSIALSLQSSDNESNSLKEYTSAIYNNNNNNNQSLQQNVIDDPSSSERMLLNDAEATVITIPTINADVNKTEISEEFTSSKSSSLNHNSLYSPRTIDRTIVNENVLNINDNRNVNSNSNTINVKDTANGQKIIMNNFSKNMGQKLIKLNEINTSYKTSRITNVDTKERNKFKKLTLTCSLASNAREKDDLQELERFLDKNDICNGDTMTNKKSILKAAEEMSENEYDDEDIEYTDEFVDIAITDKNKVQQIQTVPLDVAPNNLDIDCIIKSRHSQILENSAMILKSGKTQSDSGLGDSVDDFPSSSENSTFNNNDMCSTNIKQIQQQNQQQQQYQNNLRFARDSNSTDCEETFAPCNDETLFDYIDTLKVAATNADNDRLVCLESITLPDVVMESTNSATNIISTSGCVDAVQGHHAFTFSPSMGNECDIININGETTSNIAGNVHFIPIRVEGQCKSSQINANGNGVEIIEDASELQAPDITNLAEQLKKDLAEQKGYMNKQSEDAQENAQNLQNKIYEMQRSINNLEQELSTKTWNVERLQSELNAAQRDDEYVRKRLKLLENEKDLLRHRYNQWEDEFRKKYDCLEIQYQEIQEKYKETQKSASDLHEQLNKAVNEVEKWRTQAIEIRNELEEQVRLLKSAFENSENERKICADKWQTEFEILRTHNIEREESIMKDCEWQLRRIQKQSKEKIDKLDHEQRETKKKIDDLEAELEERCREIDDIRIYQSQVNSLRGVVNEQENSIKSLIIQVDSLKFELKTSKDQLEEQLKTVEKINVKCEQTLCDKERHMHYRIEEIRNETATFWENKLYNELTRLKSELDSVYVEERRDALHKLQAEHIEELRAITNRYTANEEELRAELTELQERLDEKTEDFLKLRDKSDNALLQMRMCLEKADRDYQVAMYREEEKRETLEKTLHKEFNEEREAMEAKLEERLHQVEMDFANKLKLTTNDLNTKHLKILENAKQKYNREKEDALKALSERYHKKLAELEEDRKELQDNHKRDLSELKTAYQMEKAALDKRDISNVQEIEQLHRKCRCLTNLFEEMRMRYERRDPRPEDLREICELRTRCETQERDLYLLTDRLRKMQIQMDELQRSDNNSSNISSHSKKLKPFKKPPVKSVPISCDVIYEESEEGDTIPPVSYESVAAVL